MKGIHWQTLTFKKSVIFLIKVNYTSHNYTACNSTWTCLSLHATLNSSVYFKTTMINVTLKSVTCKLENICSANVHSQVQIRFNELQRHVMHCSSARPLCNKVCSILNARRLFRGGKIRSKLIHFGS